jgi:ribose transport system ATP-binding protein
MNEDVKNISDSLKIKSTNIFKTQAKGLSGGNQQKVVLAKWLMRHPRFLIIDEPTRGIDIGAKYEIYQILTQLAQADTSILFISSEIEELMGVCDRILLMSYGEIVGEVRREDFDREKIMAIAFRESEDDEKI